MDERQRLNEQRIRVMAAAQALMQKIDVGYLTDPDLPEDPRAVFHPWREQWDLLHPEFRRLALMEESETRRLETFETANRLTEAVWNLDGITAPPLSTDETQHRLSASALHAVQDRLRALHDLWPDE